MIKPTTCHGWIDFDFTIGASRTHKHCRACDMSSVRCITVEGMFGGSVQNQIQPVDWDAAHMLTDDWSWISMRVCVFIHLDALTPFCWSFVVAGLFVVGGAVGEIFAFHPSPMR